MYRDIMLSLIPEKSNVESFAHSLKIAKEREHSPSLHTQTLSIFGKAGIGKRSSAPLPDDIRAPLRVVLSQSRHLRTLYLYHTTDAVFRLCAGVLGTSLFHLNTYDPLARPAALQHIARFTQLRTLEIATHPGATTPDVQHPWNLPTLEELRWKELGIYSGQYIHPDVMRFLAHCQFPRLRSAGLFIEIENDDGRQHLSTFLTSHRNITALGLMLNADIMYLLKEIPAAVRVHRLDVLVFFDSQGAGMDCAAVPEVLDALALDTHGITEVHLTLGQRWGGFYGQAAEMGQERLEFRFGAAIACAREDELEAILEAAVRIQAAGVTVYDEAGVAATDSV
jgi:hypothetical protein